MEGVIPLLLSGVDIAVNYLQFRFLPVVPGRRTVAFFAITPHASACSRAMVGENLSVSEVEPLPGHWHSLDAGVQKVYFPVHFTVDRDKSYRASHLL